VLDYKIKELRRQIEPRMNEIADMQRQIKEMDQELAQYHKSNAALDLMIGELRLKIGGMERELNTQTTSISSNRKIVRRFRVDLHECFQYTSARQGHGDYKGLKSSLTALYKKYVVNKLSSEGSDADVQKEYNRQRKYLEKSVDSLKRKLKKDLLMHRGDAMRLTRENVMLTSETNALRRELKVAKQAKRRKIISVQNLNSGISQLDAERELSMQQQAISDLQRQLARLEELAAISYA